MCARGELSEVVEVTVLSVPARAHAVHIEHAEMSHDSLYGDRLMVHVNETNTIRFALLRCAKLDRNNSARECS